MSKQSKTKNLVWVALLAALLAVTAQITLPIGPVPFSMAVLGVFFAGAMLPSLSAVACVAVYLVLGLVGIPVFAQFAAGPQVLFGPSGGYLVGYIVIAFVTSLAVQRGAGAALQLAAAVCSLFVCYLLGTLWFMLVTGNGFVAALGLCVVPFVIPDIAKAGIALLLARAVRKRLLAGRAQG